MFSSNLSLAELHQLAHTGLLAGDWLLPFLTSPAGWLAAILIAVAWPSYSRGVLAWIARALGTLALEAIVVYGLMLLPVSHAWLSTNTVMAEKAARHLNWPNPDPAAFSRLTALKLHLAVQDEAIVADKVVDTKAKAGASRAASERVIMWALAASHRQNKH
jgi:hypothetical protein